MTCLEKRRDLDRFCYEHNCHEGCPLYTNAFRCGRGYYFTDKEDEEGFMTDDEINAAHVIAFPESNPVPVIKDSGERRQFYDADGNPMAVRDIQKGKGRCDLMPLGVVAWSLGGNEDADAVLNATHLFVESGNIMYLYDALGYFRNLLGVDFPTLFLEVAKHFEEGAKKYGEHNWQKGIPVKCYIDSAVRHYLKWLRGDKDEPHDRAFCWNILCAIWTCKHMPELNDYRKEDSNA